MINDYRFRSDQVHQTPLRRFRKLSLLSLSAAGIVAASYTVYQYSGQKGETKSAVAQPFVEIAPAGEKVDIPLVLPSRGNSAPTAPETRIQLAEQQFQEPLTPPPLLEDNSLPVTEAHPVPLIQSVELKEQPYDLIEKKETTTETHLISSPETAELQTTIPPAPSQSRSEEYASTAIKEPVGDPVDDGTNWIEESVNKGDSLSRIFSRLGLSANLLHRIINSGQKAKQLALIKPGETIRVKLDDQGKFLGLIHQRSAIDSLQILPHGDGFETKSIERGLELRIAQTSGTITNSLYQGAQRAGLSDELIMELANIFGWDIDFALEIRAGDHFRLIYEEQYLDGRHYGNGPILAAEFVNRGKVFRAIRYEDEQGNSDYFSPDGHSMRKAFLRAPVDFRRISSRFTRARWHPVLGKKRPHKGVDYAAATGTPIKAAGDGRVAFRGRKGGYGKAVIIKHGQQYTTLYGHMSKYRSSVKKGTRVRQGQVIGYVGKSGLATGPHLHYEFRLNGVHRNPLTVKLPAAAPIDKRYQKDFEQKSAPLLAQLDLMSETVLAEAE